MLKAIKIRLYPTKDHIFYLNKLFGCSRYIYNRCLEYKISTYETEKKSTSLSDTSKVLTSLKGELSWIKDSHSKVLQQSLINLETAYKNFFRDKKGYPKFKAKHNNQSVRFPQDAIIGLEGNRINIIRPLSNIHFKCSRSDERYLNKNQKMIKSGTLSRNKSGQYYFSILIDKPNKVMTPATGVIGLDLGIKDFIVTSEGQRYENLKSIRNNETKIKRLHRRMSLKQKKGKNRNKARIRYAKFHNKIRNQKEYYLHSVVNQLLSENQTIVMEDLNVSGMLKNHKLAKSIQELSLNKFKTILKYKSEWYGRELIFVNRFFPSSKLCGECGYKNTELTLKDREWVCPECGSVHDRDLNAANNIKSEGIKIKIGLSSPELTLQESKTVVHSMNEETK